MSMTTITGIQGGLQQPVALERSWWSFAGAHGGYIASHLLAAATSLSEHPPRSLHVQFAAAANEGTADVEATVVREGRSAAFVEAAMRVGEVTIARASVVLGGSRPGPSVSPPPPPRLDPPEDLPELVPPAG